VRKSILAILYGNYVADGTINLDATLEDLQFDDKGGLLPIERKATVKDLITARSGVYHPASNEGDNTDFAPQRGSKVPGTYFLYNNWDFNAAGAVLEKKTGLEVYDIFEQHLAKPLGFQDFRRRSHKKSGDKSQSDHLAYHFLLSTRDMARIGYLMLRDGNWFDEQVVPADWIRRIKTTFTPRSEINPPHVREEPFEYGYMWWIYAGSDPRLKGVYTASGAYGQFITVVPDLEIVIAHKVNPSISDRLKYENATEKISVLQNQYLEIVAAITEAKLESKP
jgi:CubicO group peptidase (beta-lactamase class C family)